MLTISDTTSPPAVTVAAPNPIYNRIVFILSLLGVIIAALMWHWHGTPNDIPCGLHTNNDCADVARSPYAEFPMGSGLPVAMWGTFGYLGLTALSFLRTLPGTLKRDRALLTLVVCGAVVATLFSLRLTYFEINPDYIGKICRWCMTSQAVILAIAIASITELVRYPRSADNTSADSHEAAL